MGNASGAPSTRELLDATLDDDEARNLLRNYQSLATVAQTELISMADAYARAHAAMPRALASALFAAAAPATDVSLDGVLRALASLRRDAAARDRLALRNADDAGARAAECVGWLDMVGDKARAGRARQLLADGDHGMVLALAAEASWLLDLRRFEPLPVLVDGATSLLTAAALRTLSRALPGELRQRWRLLFSSKRDGGAYSTFCNLTLGRAPTLIVLEAGDGGGVVGGYSSQPLQCSPHFYGDHSCFIFSQRPGESVPTIYRASGENENFVYMNRGMEQIPNGIAFGGQLDSKFFGLCIEDSFDMARSDAPCSTYGSPCLASSSTFRLREVEAWALTEDVGAADGGGGGVLADEETANFMRTAGRTLHSDQL